jgi:hypothetical protein
LVEGTDAKGNLFEKGKFGAVKLIRVHDH